MGIPSYFNYIISNHSDVFVKVTYVKEIDIFCIDANSIIYDSLSSLKLVKSECSNDYFENVLCEKVANTLFSYIQFVNPKKLTIIAFDGIAPFAKMKQQKERRMKSSIISSIQNSNMTTLEETYFRWDKTAITPGTNFMNKLNDYVQDKVHLWKTKCRSSILFTGSDKYGEGEHKLFHYIRTHDLTDDTIVIYGLDADLIILSLNHLSYSKSIYLLREVPDYDTELKNFYKNDPFCMISIYKLSNHIIKKMSSTCNPYKLQDYILLSFLLGNDFMPHFPSINIRTNGIDILLNTYKSIIHDDETICKDNQIQWKLFRKFIDELAKNEHIHFIQQYKYILKEKTHNTKHLKNNKVDYLNNIPSRDRNSERYINPCNYAWEKRYYEDLFELYTISNKDKQKICINYLEGIEWCLKYYSQECSNNTWYYHYHYPPLLSDLIHFIPYFNTDFIKENNIHITNEMQLAYVIPSTSIHLLPKNLYKKLHKFYNNTTMNSNHIEFKWAFCKYFWEAHVIHDKIALEDLQYILSI